MGKVQHSSLTVDLFEYRLFSFVALYFTRVSGLKIQSSGINYFLCFILSHEEMGLGKTRGVL